MLVKFNPTALREIKLHEYLTRFALGGITCVATGLIAQKFGPIVGGLFLAFPAIFPASATLVEKHELERKAEAGIAFSLRGRLSAALDARGCCRARHVCSDRLAGTPLSSGDLRLRRGVGRLARLCGRYLAPAAMAHSHLDSSARTQIQRDLSVLALTLAWGPPVPRCPGACGLLGVLRGEGRGRVAASSTNAVSWSKAS